MRKSLTTPPKDLKEAIDWLALVGGYGRDGLDITNCLKLSGALMTLPKFKETFSSKFNGISSPDSFVKQVTERLGSGFLGYSSQSGTDLNGKGVVCKSGKYQSAYHDCNLVQKDESTYAKGLLFLAPLVYYFITFLYWMCKKYWRIQQLQYSSTSGLFYFMTAMDYTPGHFRNIKGSQIASALESSHNGFDELSAAYETYGKTSYDAFLHQLEENGSKHALSCPLTNCKILCYAYLKSRHSGKDITDAR
ncbi:variant erythrocyte surface antigen-1 family protein [Babesia caballi]|uniref:Variant erythrocyte surface antigen-1 family protein n=1 Tax=Babesia caballi TaxID=5871 RepID=A0AAV4M0M0_BABCB|nr:variant erythrocyte surface antigen-1 family protein [Babesia caballi]